MNSQLVFSFMFLFDFGIILACHLADKPPELTTSMPDYADQSNIAEVDLKITCKAGYPIEWDFDGSLPNDPAPKVTRIRRFSTDNSSCDVYESIFHTSVKYETPSFSGKFICFSVLDPKGKRASFYKFYTGSDYKIFSHSIPGMVNFARKTPQGQFVVPCPANYEQANVTLIKVLEDQKDKEISIPLGESVTYDPKIGFLLKADAFPDPIGKYKCLGTYGTKKYKKDYVDEVEIEILASEDTVSISPETTSDFQNGSIRLTCESNSEIYLNTTLLPPEFKTSFSGTPNSGSHFPFVSSILINSTGGLNKGQVTCHRKDKNTLIAIWKLDEANLCRCVWDNWSRHMKNPDDPYGFFLCSPSLHSHYEETEIYVYACQNPSECRLRVCQNEYNCLLTNYRYFLHFGPFSPELSYGILNCTVDRLSSSKLAPEEIQKFQRKIDTLSIVFDNLIIIRSRNSKTVMRVGDFQDFVCKIHSNFLVEEIRWGLKFKNGSFSFLKNGTSERDHTTIFELEFTKSIQISDLHILAVYCFASAWETGEIKNASISIFVQEQLQEVEDPNENRCSKISDTPSILQKLKNPQRGGFTWYNVTGKDVIGPNLYHFTTQFVCMSNRLTQWHLNRGDGLVERLGGTNSVIKIENSEQYCFLNLIYVFSFSFSLGNYTCQEVGLGQNETTKASVYFFVKESEFNLINHGEHGNLIVDKSQEWTLIPCRANDPGAEVQLIRHDYAGRLEALSTDPSSLQPYDPKQGFFIKTKLLYTDYNPSDVYICSSVVKEVNPVNSLETLENTHVRSFGIERFVENSNFSGNSTSTISTTIQRDEYEKVKIQTDTKNECDNEHGYTLSAVLTPWIFAIVAITLSVCLFIYARHLRWKLTNATFDGNGPIIYQVADERIIDNNEQQNKKNIIESGIINPTYVKFD